MESCWNTKIVRNRVANFLFSLMLLLYTNCSTTKFSAPVTLEIKPYEEIIEENFKKLRTAREVTLKAEISAQIIISKGTLDHFIEYLKANLKILPMTDIRQKLTHLEVIPHGKVSGSSLEFRLDYPSPGLHEFKVKAETVLRHYFIQVTDKTPFPLQVIPAELIKYTKPSSVIDSGDEEIHTLASSIAKGEDDLYRVVFKASKWVSENVQTYFDNSTISTSQKASWVLENRKGVCDEKTNLFIGLLRSLGIPSKFVIGFAGVKYNDRINFKPHGWAEVYFPSAGWIPFDIAYDQLGFIDASHLKLTESVDTSEPLTSYEWKSIVIPDSPVSNVRESENALVSIKDLEIKTKIKQITGAIAPLLVIKSKVWHQNIDAESYNVIESTIINPNKFYVITDIHLKIPDELKTMGKNNKMLLMEPGTKKTVYWIVKPTVDISRSVITTFPVEVVLSRNASSNIKFSTARAPGYTKQSFKKLKDAVNKKIRDAL